MSAIADNLQAVQARISNAAAAVGRSPESVRLLAVSKTWPLACVLDAAEAGQRAFGENYVQEGIDKIATVSGRNLEWHFIGPLQSNKTKPVAEHFDWVHSIDRLKIAERLSAQRPQNMPDLQVCLQVNVSGEASKSGVSPAEIPALAAAVAALPRLRLRGLMCIPEATDDLPRLREQLAVLPQLRAQLAEQGLALDTLSMGMSADLELAVACGSTLVRVGTAIFGGRTPRHPA